MKALKHGKSNHIRAVRQVVVVVVIIVTVSTITFWVKDESGLVY